MIKRANIRRCLYNVRARNAISRLVKLAHGPGSFDRRNKKTTKEPKSTAYTGKTEVGNADGNTDIEARIEAYRQRVHDLQNSLDLKDEEVANARAGLETAQNSLKAEQSAHAKTKAKHDELTTRNKYLQTKHDAQVAANKVLEAKHKDTVDKLTSLENRSWKEDVSSGISKGLAGLKAKARQNASGMYSFASKYKSPLAALGGFAVAGGIGYLINRKIEEARMRRRLMNAIKEYKK